MEKEKIKGILEEGNKIYTKEDWEQVLKASIEAKKQAELSLEINRAIIGKAMEMITNLSPTIKESMIRT